MITILLGLGNIGEKYEATRHNLGFEVIAHLLDKFKLSLKTGSGEFGLVEKEINDNRLIIAVPTTYMNRSGFAADALLHEYQLDPSRLLVIVDDFNLPLGKIRLRTSGSDGGHNGLASIIETLETEDFPRLRLGVGPISEGADQVDFVLGKFEQNQFEVVKKMIQTASDAALLVSQKGIEEAMTRYNNNPV